MSTSSEIPASLWHINRGPELIGVSTPLVVLSSLIVAVRIIMTVRRRTGLGYDSWLILVSLLLLWGTYIMDVLLVSLGGLGRPLAINLVIDKNRLTICMKIIFAGQVLYMTLVNTIKFSLLALYLRLFPTGFMRLLCYIVSGILTVWWLAVLLVTIFQGPPGSKSVLSIHDNRSLH